MHQVHNMRVTLVTMALNNLGAGSIIAGVVLPTVRGSVDEFSDIAAWILLGMCLFGLAQLLAGRLRNEV